MTEQKRSWVLRLLAEDQKVTYTRVAAETGASRKEVADVAAEAGLPPRRTGVAPGTRCPHQRKIDEGLLRALVGEGRPDAVIARQLGVSRQGVAWARKNWIESRSA